MPFALVFSDTHAHNFKIGGIDPKTGLNKRLVELLSCIEQMKPDLEKATQVWFLGDLLHSIQEHNNVRHMMFEALKEFVHKMTIIPGNHDTGGKDFQSVVDTPYGEFLRCGADVSTGNAAMSTASDKELVSFWCQPYMKDFSQVKFPDADILLVHGGIDGVKDGGFIQTGGIPRSITNKYKLVIAGHIHQPQKIDNIVVCGAPLHLRFGDEGERGYWTVDLDTLAPMFHALKFPEFRTLKQGEKSDSEYTRFVEDTVEDAIITDGSVAEIISQSATADSVDAQEAIKIWQEAKETIDKASIGKLGKFEVDELRITNFGSIDDTHLKFSNGLWLVTGEIDGDSGRSNGAGKSTIFEALFWALFGRTTKGLLADEVIRHGEKACQTTVVLKAGSEVVVVARARAKNKTALSLSIDGKDIVGMSVNDTQTKIENLIGINWEMFRMLVYCAQEDFKYFGEMTDSQRKDLLSLLVGIDVFDEAQKKIKGETTTIQSAKILIEKGLLEVRHEIDLTNKQVEGLDSLLVAEVKTLERLQRQIDEEKVKEVNSRKELEETVKDVEIDPALAAAVSRAETNVEIHDNILLQVEKARIGFEVEIRSIETEGKKLEKEIINLMDENKLDKLCENCGNVVTKESVYKLIQPKEQRVEELRTISSGKKVALEGLYDTARETKTIINQNKKALLVAKETYDQAKVKQAVAKNKYDNLVNVLSNMEALLKSLYLEIEKKQKAVDDITDRIIKDGERVVILQGDFDNITACLAKHTDRLVVLEKLCKLFSRRGIAAIVMQKFLKAFSKNVSNTLYNLGLGWTVAIEGLKVNNDGSVSGTIDYNVVIDDNLVPYRTLSGGEKRRIDIANAVALQRMSATRFGLKNGVLGILIFDEVISFMDDVGEEFIIDELRALPVAKKFVITHSDNLKKQFDKVITVRKENCISKVEVA